MNCEITILVENTAPVAPLQGEYGFAALVETDNRTILFDTGLGDALLRNAELLRKDLAKVDTLVISHGHFDHTGGMLPFLDTFGSRPLYCHPAIFGKRPYTLDDGTQRDIGCLFTEEEFRSRGGEIHFAGELTEIASNLYLSGEIPRLNDFEDTGGSFVRVNEDGDLVDDFISDDSAMIIKHPDGLIVLSGCAHAGIVNTIEHAKKALNEKRILCYIGGTHLLHATEERIDKTVGYLNSCSLSKMSMSHCTGFHASCRLSQDLNCETVKGETGLTLSFR